MAYLNYLRWKFRKQKYFVIVLFLLTLLFFFGYHNNRSLTLQATSDAPSQNVNIEEKPIQPGGTQAKPPQNRPDLVSLEGLPNLLSGGGASRDEKGVYAEGRPEVAQLPRKVHFPPVDILQVPQVDYKKKNYGKVQAEVFEEGGAADKQKLEKIRETFMISWKAYRTHALDYDELLPLTNEKSNPFVGWSITLIDSLDTIYLMGLKEEFDLAVKKLATINFKKSPRELIPTFETVIRALGGLIAAYDVSGEKVILDKAIECGDMLAGVFDTPNGMPILYYWWSDEDTEKPKFAPTVSCVAEFGTLLLEFTRLAQITGNNTYFHYVQKVTNEIEELVNDEYQAGFELSGLLPTHLDTSGCQVIRDPDAAKDSATTFRARMGNEEVWCQKQGLKHSARKRDYTLGGLADSYYEYLIKQHHMLNGANDQYLKLFDKALDRIKGKMLFKAKMPSILVAESNTIPHLKTDPDDVLFISELVLSAKNKLSQKTWASHLSCFTGGMFELAGKVGTKADSKENLRIGQQLTAGCYKLYELMDLMPEWISLDRCPQGTTEDDPECQFDVRRRVAEIRKATEQKDLADHELLKDLKVTSKPASRQPPGIIETPEIIDEAEVEKEILARYLNANNQNFDQVQKNLRPSYDVSKAKKFPKKPLSNTGPEYPLIHSELIRQKLTVNSRGDVHWPVGGAYHLPLWANQADTKFILRPELIESVFYMYRITGDLEWREKAWKMFENTIRHVQHRGTVSSLNDVTHLYLPTGKVNSGNRENKLESFWLAETLKYYYLIFEDKDVWSLDDYVFNTEAHPFKRANK